LIDAGYTDPACCELHYATEICWSLFSFLDGAAEPTAKQAQRANENGQESQTYSQPTNNWQL